MLLLDEPTNHLDAESVAWLERYLEEYPSTVIAVTHDRYFLDNVAGWILELDRGHGIPWQGNYSSWLEQKEKRLALEEREREALRKTLERELEWVRQNPKARQAKSKARLQRYEELPSKEFQERNETNEIYIPPGERLGDLVIEVKNLRKGLRRPAADRQPVVQPAARRHRRHHRPERRRQDHAVPHAHRRRRSPTRARSASARRVKLAYVDQSRHTLDDKKTVWQEISGGLDMIKVGNYETSSRGYVGRFNFKGTQQQQLIGELSGGERNRVHLAKVLKTGGNVLLLDEPTNDLDVETLRALEEALLNFPGCAVVISHDRWFLDRIATHILAFEGNSRGGLVRGQLPGVHRGLQAPQGRGRGPAAPHQVQAAHPLDAACAAALAPRHRHGRRGRERTGPRSGAGRPARRAARVRRGGVRAAPRDRAPAHPRYLAPSARDPARGRFWRRCVFTALSYWLLSIYDFLALRYLRKRDPLRAHRVHVVHRLFVRAQPGLRRVHRRGHPLAACTSGGAHARSTSSRCRASAA